MNFLIELIIYILVSLFIYRFAYIYIRFVDNKERKKLNDKEFEYYKQLIELEKELKNIKKEKLKDDFNNNNSID